MRDLGDYQRAWNFHASETSAVINRVGNWIVPNLVKILFSLHIAKGKVIAGPVAKQQKWSIPRSIDATTTSASTWYFSYAEHGKLIIEIGIQIFPKFRATKVEKLVLSHELIIVCGIDLYCCFTLNARNKMLVISNRLLIISTPVGQQRQLLLSSIFVLWLSPCRYWWPVLSLTAPVVTTSQ